ncbi:MAG: pantothenate kinase [Oscillospiraceae bacterium]|nr:pantothenate kinase [Oscillospiraceae bacterium]
MLMALLDMGGSTAKGVAAAENGAVLARVRLPAEATAAQLLERLQGALPDERIERLALTGLRSASEDTERLPLPAVRAPELEAVGLGGLALAGLSSAIVVSMGTGTAILAAGEDGVRHLGGSGLGGGTLAGLGRALLGADGAEALCALAADGDIARADLTIGDLTSREGTLDSALTAANMGRACAGTSPQDMAAGLINLVLQNIGVMAMIAAKGEGQRDIVLTGSLTLVPQCEEIFRRVAEAFGVRFIIPPDAEYAAAIGIGEAIGFYRRACRPPEK